MTSKRMGGQANQNDWITRGLLLYRKEGRVSRGIWFRFSRLYRFD